MQVVITNLALVVWVAGLLMYFFVKYPRVAEVGKLMFVAGLIAWLEHKH